MDALVYLVRHGMHDWLAAGTNRLAGRLPVRLNDDGRAQVLRVDHVLDRQPLDWIVASPLQRTVESAEIIARPRGLEVACDERFAEWAFGVWEGMWINDIQARYRQEWQTWRTDPTHLHLPGAETLEQVADRMEQGCLAWMDRGGTGMIVSHEDPLAALLCRLIGMPLSNLRSLDIRTGSLSIVRRTRHGTVVEAVNVGTHSPNYKGVNYKGV